MHDCALGGQGGPSAPRVEHRYYAGDGINGKNGKGGVWKSKPSLIFYFYWNFENPRTKSTRGESDDD